MTQDPSIENKYYAQDTEDKFRRLDELTDSEESDMEHSEDEDEGAHRSKRARLEPVGNAVSDEVRPKWSDPNPYTSLPPPSETTGKRVDVVKLIRKARNTALAKQDAGTDSEDFISFDMDGAENHDDLVNNGRAPSPEQSIALGKRKREKSTAASRREDLRRSTDNYTDGMILEEWLAKNTANATPWVTTIDSTDAAGIALHKEVLDFYEWVRPREFEQIIRADVVRRLSSELNRLEYGELKAFGSYAAGLYLPVADMDLVYITRSYNPRKRAPNGLPPKLGYRVLRSYADLLERGGVARERSTQVISGAKVPIIKFIDDISGLKIDLSFNNESGVVAIESFEKWKRTYPAMPIIVSIIKQYLMIRGLNDVSIGGLGGFSVICLVTSLLQHWPSQEHPPNLGQLLVEFFNLYGNLFDRHKVAIRMDPPSYVHKVGFSFCVCVVPRLR